MSTEADATRTLIAECTMQVDAIERAKNRLINMTNGELTCTRDNLSTAIHALDESESAIRAAYLDAMVTLGDLDPNE